ncbi:hypothetical protein [Vibrio mediterranei]|uniref:hypothetical protein n=1 Tax=Vibrio mediterranei TaxID=689 RepID=UPI00148CA6B5|nr:hypothetical protein [Vibrio mediterranei]NOI26681.1 hypothetical protein [Vibrio mediterranei]
MKGTIRFFITYSLVMTPVSAEPSIDIYKRCYLDIASHLHKSVNGFEMALEELSLKYHKNIALNLTDEQHKEIASGEIKRLNYLLCKIQLKEQDYQQLVSQLVTDYSTRLK